MNRQDYSMIIIPLRVLPVGKMINLTDLQALKNELQWRGDNAHDTVSAMSQLSNAFNEGFSVKHMSVDMVNATFLLTRGEADNLLYGQ